MFDLTSSKLLLLAVVALLVIGPKDFPILLRAIGKYVGIIRGHAKEFRAQFDEAMRESELGQIKKDMEKFGRETEESLTATKQSVEQTLADARQGVEASVTSVEATTSAGAPVGTTAEATSPKPAVDVLPEAAVETAPAPPADAAPQAEATPETAAPPESTPVAGSSQTAVKTAAAHAVERTGV